MKILQKCFFFQKIGGISEGTRPFPLKIFDTKISFNSTSGECIKRFSTFWGGEGEKKLPHFNFLLLKASFLLDTILKTRQ